MNAIGCDSLTAPTALDAARVTTFWRDGWANYPSLGADVANSAGVFNTASDSPSARQLFPGYIQAFWGDWSWAQTSFFVDVEYVSGGNWYRWTYRWRDDDVGAHGLMTGYPDYYDLTPTPVPPPPPTPTPLNKVDMRVFQEDFDLRGTGAPNGAPYRVCVWSYNVGYPRNDYGFGYGFGPENCSPSFWVSW